MSEETQIPSKKVWIIIAAVGMFAFMSTLDSSIVNIALPIMSKQLSIPMNQATWVVSIYLIIISGLLTFFGRLGDQIGKIRVFRFGTYIFTVGSLIAGINLGLWFLLFARTIQAIGAAMTMSNSFGIVTTIAPPSQRARGMALNSSFVSLGTIAGPGLGGIILQHFSWSYIFWINVPVGIIAIIIGRLVFPKSVEIDHDALKFDYVGISTLFLFITTFFLAINIGQEQGFLSIIPVTLTVFALIVFVIFIVHELHAEMPLLDLTIFKSKLFTISLVAAFLVFTSNFFINVISPFYFENLKGINAGTAGLFLMVWPISMLIATPISGYIADYFDQEYITLCGLTILGLSYFGWWIADAQTSSLFIVLLLVCGGVGMAFFQTPNNALIMSNAPASKLGVAGSLNALARNLGMITGTSLVTTVLYAAMSKKIGHNITSYPSGHGHIFVYGMHVAFSLAIVLVAITWLITIYRVILKIKHNHMATN